MDGFQSSSIVGKDAVVVFQVKTLVQCVVQRLYRHFLKKSLQGIEIAGSLNAGLIRRGVWFG